MFSNDIIDIVNIMVDMVNIMVENIGQHGRLDIIVGMVNMMVDMDHMGVDIDDMVDITVNMVNVMVNMIVDMVDMMVKMVDTMVNKVDTQYHCRCLLVHAYTPVPLHLRALSQQTTNGNEHIFVLKHPLYNLPNSTQQSTVIQYKGDLSGVLWRGTHQGHQSALSTSL